MKIILKYAGLIYCFLQITSALVDVSIDQALLNPGFHKLLKTNITIYGNLSSCKLLVEEKFPRSLYVNEDEIENSASDILTRVNQKLNVEATATVGIPFSIFVYLNRSQPITTSSEYHSQYLYFLPVLVRYHDPKSGGGHREFKKQPPALFARCPESVSLASTSVVKFPCEPHSVSEICEWTSLSYTQKNLLTQFVVPVGNVDLYEKVFFSTHTAAYLGMLYILYHLLSVSIIA